MNTSDLSIITNSTFTCDEGCGATFPNWDENEEMFQVETDTHIKLVCQDCAYELQQDGWTWTL